MTFEDAWHLTMSWEGGDRVHEIPGDPGGLTKYGISQRAHPDVDIANLDAAGARRITKDEYWTPLRIHQLPWELRWQVFDMAFNAGVDRSARLLQQAINLCEVSQGTPYRQIIVVDGKIGPRTVAVARDMPHPDRVARVFKAYRTNHYLRLATNRTKSARFIHGWLRRAEGEYNG